jgi:hydroxyethylthiazole kinase
MSNITARAANLIAQVRKKSPLVHQITNYVTVNDCANITLAAGASPVMADDIAEAAEITAISSVLLLNIGTLNEKTVDSMLVSGKKANELGLPVVFDPVGAGASTFRDQTTRMILSRIKIAVVRGNLSEISFAAGLKATTKGVDASGADFGNDAVFAAKETARQSGCVAAVTGATDIVSDGQRVIRIQNGHAMLSGITGTGCMATALIGAFAGVAKDYLAAAVAGVAVMGIAGEIAFEAAGNKGLGSYHAALTDAVSLMDENVFEKRAKISEI